MAAWWPSSGQKSAPLPLFETKRPRIPAQDREYPSIINAVQAAAAASVPPPACQEPCSPELMDSCYSIETSSVIPLVAPALPDSPPDCLV
jgi:hypothetical protein